MHIQEKKRRIEKRTNEKHSYFQYCRTVDVDVVIIVVAVIAVSFRCE